jgi:hypothetical protein
MEKQDKDFMLKSRDDIIKKIRKEYVDIPPILHEKNKNGTSKDLVIDEIAVMGIRETIKTIFCKLGEIDSQVGKVTTKDYQDILEELKMACMDAKATKKV